MVVDLSVIKSHLNARPGWAEELVKVVGRLEAAIAAGMVPNKMFVDAKDWINRACEKSAEAFLDSGASNDGHHKSNWWRAAYHHDAFVSGAHNVPSALKRAEKGGLKEYAAFIKSELLPLNELLAAAKPLIKKKGELPKVK